MTKFSSVFSATLQYAFGIYIFKKPDLSGCGPLLSSLVVLFALFLVLWSLPLYPSRLRKLVWMGNCLAQYLIAVFMIEYIMGCFWFPLETAILALLPKIAQILEETLLYFDLSCGIPCDLLRREGTGMFCSYLLSFLILIAAMHATRLINLKLLSSGFQPFFYDVSRRLQRFVKNCPINIGFPRFRPRRSRKPEYCTSEDDGFEFEPDNDTPDAGQTTDTEYPYSYR